jgi:hypothetical protein
MQKYISILIGAVFFVLGFNLIRDHFNNDLEKQLDEKIENFEKLVKKPVKIGAFLDSVYKETTVEIMKVPIKFYETKYFFQVDNKTYQGVYAPKEKPTIPFIEVSYLAENPNINNVDPQKELENLRGAKGSNFGLYAGIILLLLGVSMIYSSVKGIKAEKKAKEDEEQRLIDEDNNRMLGNSKN